MDLEQATQIFSKINLDSKVIESISKNKKVCNKLKSIVERAGGEATKGQGNLLYALSTKLPGSLDAFESDFIPQIMNNNVNKIMQLEEGFEYLKQ